MKRRGYVYIENVPESRELMEKKAPPSIMWFVYFIFLTMVIGIIWACLGEIDEYTKAVGEVRPSKPASSVASMTGGRVETVYVKEGQAVEKGDVLLSFDKESALEQKTIYEDSYKKVSSDLENTKKLRKSIEQEKNLFTNSGEEAAYFAKYEQYIIDSRLAMEQINENNINNQKSIKDAESILLSSKQQLSKVEKDYDAYKELLSAVENDSSYKGNHTVVKSMYDNYKNKRDKLKNTLNEENHDCEASLKSNNNLSNANVAAGSLNAEINSIKQEFILEIKNKLEQLSSSVYTLENEKVRAENTVNYISRLPNNQGLTREKSKSDAIVALDDSVNSLSENLNSLKQKLSEINAAVENADMIASVNGIVTLMQDINEGDVVHSGTEILRIIPNDETLRVNVSISEQDISKVSVGQKTEYIINSIPYQEYGKITGELISLSQDSIVDEKQGGKYFIAEATISDVSMKNNRDIVREIRSGMIAEVRIVTGSKKIAVWLLQKINLME